jgi:hypothetical protein
MHKILLFVIALVSYFGTPALAEPITYQVTVNSSSITGTAGSLDFNFNPGLSMSQTASLQIVNFTSNGSVTGAPQIVGDASGGPLPITVSFDNGTAFNDYFQGFTFGSTLSFQVGFSGPALSAPDGTSTSGSTFAFSMFSDPAGTIPALTSDTTDGFAFIGSVNLYGTTTISNFSAETAISPISNSVVPEPSYLGLLGATTATMMVIRLKLSR